MCRSRRRLSTIVSVPPNGPRRKSVFVTSTIERFVSNGVPPKRTATSSFDEFAKLADSDCAESKHVKSEAREESTRFAIVVLRS
jgi:hypothetical protein